MASVFLFPYFVSLVCSILLVPSISHAINLNTNSGFSISIFHHDSPQSPFYNHSMTTYERRVAATHRSINRLKYLLSLSSATATTSENGDGPFPLDISTKIIPNTGEYIATIYIGTPITQVTVIIDTGSGINWVKGPPNYDPKKSSSYREQYCVSGSCPFMSTCNNTSNLCGYQISYADGSTTSGITSYEDFGFDSPNGGGMVGVRMLQFGFSTKAIGFVEPRNGVLGLNRDPESFISQLGIKRFSHCFVIKDYHGTGSRMHFGSSVVITNLTTPIEPSMKNAYYVRLDGISIGNTLVEMPQGGFLFDTGSAFTMLGSEAYGPFIREMRQQVKKPLVNPVYHFDLCFEGAYADLHDLPSVTFRFARVGFELIKESTYVEAANGIWCLAIIPNPFQASTSIIGNFQMRNLLVGYDLERQVISFSSANCSAF